MQASAQRLLSTTPQLIDHIKGDSRKETHSPSRGADDDVPINQSEWRKEKEKMDSELKNLSEQLRHRTQVYLQREAEMKRKIDGLEKQLEKRIDPSYTKRMSHIRNLHETIIGGIMTIQGNTAKVLQDQEKDLMRAFRARLDDVTKELEIQKIRRNDSALDLQAEHRHVISEWQRAKELAELFEKRNEKLTQENKRLQEKLRSRDDDKQATMKALILAKKDANRVQAENDALKARVKQIETAHAAALDRLNDLERGAEEEDPSQPTGKTTGGKTRIGECASRIFTRELKYREALQRCKKLLDIERANNRSVRDSYNKLLGSRTELEALLRQVLDDVKGQIKDAKERQQQPLSSAANGRVVAGGASGGASAIPGASVLDLSAADRERVLEMLLSQHRVVTLLYEKTFPNQPEVQARAEAGDDSNHQAVRSPDRHAGGHAFGSTLQDISEEEAAFVEAMEALEADGPATQAPHASDRQRLAPADGSGFNFNLGKSSVYGGGSELEEAAFAAERIAQMATDLGHLAPSGQSSRLATPAQQQQQMHQGGARRQGPMGAAPSPNGGAMLSSGNTPTNSARRGNNHSASSASLRGDGKNVPLPPLGKKMPGGLVQSPSGLFGESMSKLEDKR